VPELQGEPQDIAKEKCRLAAKEVTISPKYLFCVIRPPFFTIFSFHSLAR
jgi:hypothetical protein